MVKPFSAWFAALLFVGSLTQAARAADLPPQFSIDPASPSISPTLGPYDILRPGPAVVTQGDKLGLKVDFASGSYDNLNDFSYGVETIPSPSKAGSTQLLFGVDRNSVGVVGSSVFSRAQPGAAGAHGSIFSSNVGSGFNSLFAGTASLGLVTGFFGDAIDGLDVTARQVYTYFALDALSFSNAFGDGTLASTIQISRGNGVMGLFAGAAAMGLLDKDRISGLVLDDTFEPGVLNPGRDRALITLDPFSPSTFTFTGKDYERGVQGSLSPADVLFTDFDGSFSLWAGAGDLGLLPEDHITAIALVPEPPVFVLAVAGLVAFSLRRRRAAQTAMAGVALALGLATAVGADAAPLFVGPSPPVAGSSGAIVLNDDVTTQKTFRWQSVDTVLGDVDSGVVTATTWNYLPGTPPRIVFVGVGGGVTVSGNFLLAPYNRGVVDLVKDDKRMRYLVTPATVRLSVDTDRNGTVEPDADEKGKAEFTPDRGAVLLVNFDADGAAGTRDDANDMVDANGDVDDITPLVVQKSGLPAVPTGFEFALRLNKDVATLRARVFREIAVAAPEVLGPGKGTVAGNFKETVLTAASMAGAGALTLGMEGISYPAKDSGALLDATKNFDGLVDVELLLRKATSKAVIASDKVRLRASPWLMLGHSFKSQEVFVVALKDPGAQPNPLNNTPFVDALDTVITGIGGVTLTKVKGSDYGNDPWMQDEIEVGFARSPSATAKMHSAFDGPRDRGLDGYPKKELLKKDTAAFAMSQTVESSLNSFGNLEVTFPLTAEGKDWLFGRIYYGSTAGDREPQKPLVDFLEAQLVQSPVALDSAWLYVGHVDEFISFVPFPAAGAGDKAFKVLLASPKRAIEILEAEKAAGRGDVKLSHAPMEKVKDLITAHKGRNVADADSWQSRIDGVKTVMKAKFGLVDGDFVEVPVLFSQNFLEGKMRATALVPDMVNLLVVNGHLVPPEPFFDPFKDDFKAKLTAIGYAAANLHFLDNFIWYHQGNGQVHCGTNSRREIVASPGWWSQR